MTEMTNIESSAPKSRWHAQARAGGQGFMNLINLAFMIWMIWDIRHRGDDEINGKRKLWYMAAFTPPIGPIAYLIFGRKRQPKTAEIPLEIPAES